MPTEPQWLFFVCAQSRSRTCTHSGLSRVAQPLAYLGKPISDLGFLISEVKLLCATPFVKSEFRNPKSLHWSRMDLNHRCLVVGQESSPLDHGTVRKRTERREQKVEKRKIARGPHPPVARLSSVSFLLSPFPCCRVTSRSLRAECAIACCRATLLRDENLRGLESNQRPPGSEPGVATSSNHPALLSIV